MPSFKMTRTHTNHQSSARVWKKASNKIANEFIQKITLPVTFLAILCLSGCTSLFFKPTKDLADDPDIRKFGPEDVYFKSSDNVALHGWYLRARGEERGTVLVCHGNVENISTHIKLDLWLVEAGYNVFIFDYRGYGKSDGTPHVTGIHLDAEAALGTLLNALPRSKNDAVIVMGKSLGGAVAAYTVANSPFRSRVKALILDSAFSSYRMIAREKIAESVIGWPFQYPLSLLVNNDYSPVDWIGKVSPIPVLIMHGYDDLIVPEHHSRKLYEAASNPKELWDLKIEGHVKSWTDEDTRKRLLEYLAVLPVSAM